MKNFGKYTTMVAWFVFSIGVIAVYKTFDNFRDITKGIGILLSALRPFLIAFVIAYILNLPSAKIRKRLERMKWRWGRRHSLGISIAIVYILFLAAIAVIIWALVPALYKNALELYANLPSYMASFQQMIEELPVYDKIRAAANSNFSLVDLITDTLMSVDITQFGRYAQGVVSVTSEVVSFFVSVIISVYMLIDKEMIKGYIKKLMRIFWKNKNIDQILVYTARVNDIFTNYIYSRLICCTIMAIICVVVLLMLKVKYALILGLFIGACDLIPYFGSIIATLIAILVNAVTGNGIWHTVWVAVVLVVLQQIDGNVLAPKIMGDSLKIRPLLVIFAVVVGGSLFGVMGMLFSVPVVTVIKTVFSDFVEAKEREKES